MGSLLWSHPTAVQPVRSDVPVLLISGGYDMGTPPRWAAALQKHLPNSFHVVFPGWTHGPTTHWGNPCAMELANLFFNDPQRLPESGCYRQLKENPFSGE